MKKIRIFAIITLLAQLFLGELGAYALGDEVMEQTMTVSPPHQKIILVPGEVFEGSVEVSNPATSPYDLKYSVTVGSFSLGKDKDGNVDYNDTDVDTITGYNQIMDWIQLGKTSGTVKPNEVDVVPFTINVPADAPAGGQYATIIVQDDTLTSMPSSAGVSIQSVVRFASGIFAEVAGKTVEKAEIVENSVPAFSFNTPLSVSSVVANTGNVHINAEYILQVWSLFSDTEIYSNEEEPAEKLIMPDSKRYNEQSWSGAPRVGIFRVRQTVKALGEVSVIEKIVIICPLWLIIAIIIMMAFAVISLVLKAKSRKSKKIQ